METKELQTIQIKPLATFESTMDDLITLVNDYSNIVVNDETFEEAKKARATLRNKRVEIQKIEKQNTDQLNDLKNQNWANAEKLIAIITPTEDKIDSGIKAIENRKAEAKAEKERIEREKIEAAIRLDQERVAKAEADRLAKIEAEQKIEADRLAALQVEIDAKNKAEQERLDKIKAEQEAKETAMRKEQERIQKDQQEREAKIKADQEKIEAEKRAISEQKAREEADKKRLAELDQAKKEAAEKARIEVEAKAKRQAEEKAIAIQRDKEEAIRQEALKPDKTRLIELSSSLRLIVLPVLRDKKAQLIIGAVELKLEELSQFIQTETSKL